MRRSSAALVAAFTLLAIGACSGEDGEPEGLSTDDMAATDAPTGDATDPGATPTDQPTSTAEASPTDEPEADPTSDDGVIAGYLEAREAHRKAYNPADPENADLLDYYDGEALQLTQDELQGLVDEGHSEEVELDYHPTVIINEPGGVAVVEDCLEVHVQTIETDSGDTVGEPITDVWNIRYHLELRDETWTVTKGEQLEDSCTPGA